MAAEPSPSPADHEATQLLLAVRAGDSSASSRLLALVYDELRALAAASMRRERPDHTLEPTALVHEAYLRLVDQTRVDWKGRAHFFAVAAETIRRVLVDHARKVNAEKRGGHRHRTTLHDDLQVGGKGQDVDLLALEEALARLTALHPRQARVVELRFFGGLSIDETAQVLGVVRSTVADDWMLAKAWLSRELSE